MDALDQAGLRVLRWRFEGLPARIGQVLLIGGLIWLHIHSQVVPLWIAVASATAMIDAYLSRRLYERLGDRPLGTITTVSRTISAGAFALVCFILLIDRSGFGLAAAMLVSCAINLNNAVMTRGSRRFFLSLVGPSSVCLIALPFVAWTMDQNLSLGDTGLLTLGAGAYTVFIVLLATALYRESKALRTALEAAQTASQAKSTFLAMTSHEIRTPLNGVLGMAQAMQHDALSEVQRGRVAVIRQSGEALLEILNDILDLSKIEAGKLELERAPFDLETVTRSAHDAFSASALSKGLGYRLVFDEAARGAYDGDASRVRQVLCNLLSNALKFTECGEVELVVAGRGGGVRFSVRDTGPGVAEGFSARLFDKFTQADSSTTRRFGGTGLGLAICRELCEAMGGSVSVESALGVGSTFFVDLPLGRSAGGSAPAPALPREAATAPGDPGAPLRVLAAEDNPINQLVLRTLLEQAGLDTTIVETGVEVIEAWEAGDYDLILMDIQMPVMDGPTATRAIRVRERESGRTPIPIIALTANAMKHQASEYLAAGMDAIVAKPIEIAQLFAAIDRFSLAERATQHADTTAGTA